MTGWHKIPGSENTFLLLESLQILQQHHAVPELQHTGIWLSDLHISAMGMHGAVSSFFDHEFLITFTTILQGIRALGRTQISHKSFHLKNQLSQNLILQINHLLTQVHCFIALTLDSTRENQKQMVRWLSSMTFWFALSLPVNMWAALTYLKTGSYCVNLAILTQDRVYFFPPTWQDGKQFVCQSLMLLIFILALLSYTLQDCCPYFRNQTHFVRFFFSALLTLKIIELQFNN